MSFFDEPKDQPGTRQIVSTDDGEGNRSQSWSTVPDYTREELWRINVINGLSLPRTIPTVLADAVIWLSVAAIIAKSVTFVNLMIKLGYVAELPATLSLGVLGLIGLFVFWVIHETIPKAYTLLIYRSCLFLFGVILGVLP